MLKDTSDLKNALKADELDMVDVLDSLEDKLSYHIDLDKTRSLIAELRQLLSQKAENVDVDTLKQSINDVKDSLDQTLKTMGDPSADRKALQDALKTMAQLESSFDDKVNAAVTAGNTKIKQQVETSLNAAQQQADKTNAETKKNIDDLASKSAQDFQKANDGLQEANQRLDESEASLKSLDQDMQNRLNDVQTTLENVKVSANAAGQINQFFNSEFNPDLANWSSKYSRASALARYNGSMTLDGQGDMALVTNYVTPVIAGLKIGIRAMMFGQPDEQLTVEVIDAATNQVVLSNSVAGNGDVRWVKNELIGVIPADTKKILVKFSKSGDGRGGITQPMMVFDVKEQIGEYVSGAYNNNEQIVSIQNGLDGLTTSVTDNQNNLSLVRQQANNIAQQVANNKTATDSAKVQTDNLIAQEVNDRKSGDSSVLAQTASNITAAVSNKADKSYVDQRADAIVATVNTNKGDTTASIGVLQNSINTNVSTLNGKISTTNQTVSGIDTRVKDNASGLQTLTTQTDNRLTQEVTDRKSGDANTLTQSKDFTTSQVKSSETGLQTAITQSANGVMLNLTRVNYVTDSSLVEGMKWWNTTTFTGGKTSASKGWYYSGATRSGGVPSLGINNTTETTGYAFATSQPITFPGGTTKLYVNADVLIRTIGGTSNDYLIVYVGFLDKDGKSLGQVNASGTYTEDTGNKWVPFTTSIDIPTGAKTAAIQYQLRGNANAYIARPYVSSDPLPLGLYVPGSVSNTSTTLGLFNDNFVLGIRDNIGNIISGINGDTSGTVITGNKIVLNGSTSVLGDFWSKNVNAIQVNAQNIKGGTISGVNYNVDKQLQIATGGAVTWNTDATIRGYSDIGEYWKYVGDGSTPYVTLTQKGNVSMDSNKYIQLDGQLTAPTGTNKQVLMWNHSDGAGQSNSAYSRTRISSYGVENQLWSTSAQVGKNVSMFTNLAPTGLFGGIGQANPSIALSTRTGEIQGRTLAISSGYSTSDQDVANAVRLGVYTADNENPARFAITSYSYVMPTTSGTANTRITAAGSIMQAGSMRKLKQDITYDFSVEESQKLIDLHPAKWFDKLEVARYDTETVDHPKPVQYLGLIAEEVEQAGLTELVDHNEDGEVTSVNYDRLAVALLPALADMREKVAALTFELEKLKEK